MKRKPGFYRVKLVKHFDTICVAEWDGKDWYLCGKEEMYKDSDFYWIDSPENKIQ